MQATSYLGAFVWLKSYPSVTEGGEVTSEMGRIRRGSPIECKEAAELLEVKPSTQGL